MEDGVVGKKGRSMAQVSIHALLGTTNVIRIAVSYLQKGQGIREREER